SCAVDVCLAKDDDVAAIDYSVFGLTRPRLPARRLLRTTTSCGLSLRISGGNGTTVISAGMRQSGYGSNAGSARTLDTDARPSRSNSIATARTRSGISKAMWNGTNCVGLSPVGPGARSRYLLRTSAQIRVAAVTRCATSL